MKMPEKDPGLWALLTSIPPVFQGAFLAFVIAWLRLIYEGKEGKFSRKLLESVICSVMSFGAAGVIDVFGLPDTACWMIGIVIGFVGVMQMREFALRWLGNRADRG